MLRAETTPNGVANTSEFGSTKTVPGFAALYEMSALQHVNDGTPYPAVMLTTGMNDARVGSWQPGKMTGATASGDKQRQTGPTEGGLRRWPRHRWRWGNGCAGKHGRPV